jgi:hypothetical protein
MFTQRINGKRKCEHPNPHIHSWDYLKEVLSDCGFAITQSASPKEYIMKGCKGQILIYVKFSTDTQCKVLFVSDDESHQSLDMAWTLRSRFRENGDLVLVTIRQVWSSHPKLSE